MGAGKVFSSGTDYLDCSISPHLDLVRIPDWYSHPNKHTFLLNYSVPCRVEKDSDLD